MENNVIFIILISHVYYVSISSMVGVCTQHSISPHFAIVLAPLMPYGIIESSHQ